MNVNTIHRLKHGSVACWAALLLALLASTESSAQPDALTSSPVEGTAPSSFFYTIYQQFGENISWLTCGYDEQSSGCYGSGSIGPFSRACSVAGSSTRAIVADSNASSGRTTLYFYKQEESSTPSSTLQKVLELPDLPVSTSAICHLSVLGNFAYFGTSESSTYYKIDLRSFAITSGSSCGGNTSAITAGNDFVVVSQSGCFVGFNRQGSSMISGGAFTDYFVPGGNAFDPLR